MVTIRRNDGYPALSAHYEYHGFARKEEGGSSFEFFGEYF